MKTLLDGRRVDSWVGQDSTYGEVGQIGLVDTAFDIGLKGVGSHRVTIGFIAHRTVGAGRAAFFRKRANERLEPGVVQGR